MYLYIVSRYTTDVLQNIGERETTAMMDEEEEVVENRSKLCRMRIYSPPESCIQIESNGTINSLILRSISCVFIGARCRKWENQQNLIVLLERALNSLISQSRTMLYMLLDCEWQRRSKMSSLFCFSSRDLTQDTKNFPNRFDVRTLCRHRLCELTRMRLPWFWLSH